MAALVVRWPGGRPRRDRVGSPGVPGRKHPSMWAAAPVRGGGGARQVPSSAALGRRGRQDLSISQHRQPESAAVHAKVGWMDRGIEVRFVPALRWSGVIVLSLGVVAVGIGAQMEMEVQFYGIL